MRKFNVIEGLIDLKTNKKFYANTNTKTEVAQKVIYTMKDNINNFQHASNGFTNGQITAIDLGLGGDLITNNFFNNYPCGKHVTVFYSTNRAISSIGNDLGTMLSNVDIMNGSLPFYDNTSAVKVDNIQILNENFINIGGIFEYVAMRSYLGYVNFDGSTFKTAPRICKRMDEYYSYPTTDGPIGTLYPPTYAPFKNCPNVEKIEYQGDFGIKLEYLGAVDFTYTDANGIEHIDAYPQGGSPAVIYNYLTINTYTIGASGNFPNIGTEELQFAINPTNIKYIDTSNSIGECPEVLGININNSPKLKIIELELPKIKLEEDIPFMYGAKALGYKLNAPKLKEIRGNFFGIENSIEERIIEGERIIGYPIFTPQWIAGNINSGWGQALKKIFDDDEPLLSPEINSNVIKVISNYYSRNSIGNQGPFFVPTANGLTGFTIPPLPETTEIIDGYCKNLYEGSFFCTDFEVEFNGTIVSATHHATIPALPESIKVSRNYLYETFKDSFGQGELIELETTDNRNLTAFYGIKTIRYSDEVDEERLYGILNCTPENAILTDIWENEQNKHINLTYPFTLHAPVTQSDEALSFKELIEKAFGSTENRPNEIRNYSIREGIELIPNGSLPLMEYAINWQTRTWYHSTVDPTQISTLQPLNSFVKSENAYSEVLMLDYLNPQGGVRRLTLSTGTIEDKNYRNIVLVGTDASVPILTETIKNQLSYDINDVITPPNFFIQNQNNQIYDSLFNAFNFLFYGDFRTWVINHGGGEVDFSKTLKYLTGTDKLIRRSSGWGAGEGNRQESVVVFNARITTHETFYRNYSVYAGYGTDKNREEGIGYMPSDNTILSPDFTLNIPITQLANDIKVNVSTSLQAQSVEVNFPPEELFDRTF